MSIPPALRNFLPGQHFRFVFVTGGDGGTGYLASGPGASALPLSSCADSALAPSTDYFPYNTGGFDTYNGEMQNQWNSSDISGGIEEYLGHKVHWRAMCSWVSDNSYNSINYVQCKCLSPTPPFPTPPCCYGNCIDNILYTPAFANDGVAVYDLCGTHIADTVQRTSQAEGTKSYLFNFSTEQYAPGAGGANIQVHGAISRNQNGAAQPADSGVWTGTNQFGFADVPTATGGGAGQGLGFNSGFGGAFSAMVGNCSSTSVVEWVDHASATHGDRLFMYAISDVLQMPVDPPPPPPPIAPNTIPLIHKRIGVCRPYCMINLPGGITGNVIQPQPVNMSTKMRNAKRAQTRGGWRKVSLNTYKAMKKGNVTFLGSCYQKKN